MGGSLVRKFSLLKIKINTILYTYSSFQEPARIYAHEEGWMIQ